MRTVNTQGAKGKIEKKEVVVVKRVCSFLSKSDMLLLWNCLRI